MLKDQLKDRDGWRAYVLFTEHSLNQMGLRPEGMYESSGSYPDVGEVKTASVDLRPRYQALTKARQAYVGTEEADVTIEHQFDAPPQVLWDWLNDPQKRTRWNRLRTWSAVLRPGGRTGVGAKNHCAHGMGTLVETIMDWRPYRYFTVQAKQDSLGIAIQQTFELEPLPDGEGTRLLMRTRIEKATPRWLMGTMIRKAARRIWESDFDHLGHLISEGTGG